MSAPDTGADVGSPAGLGAGRDPRDRKRLRQLADEQRALRRVATLAAKGARPAEVFGVVADELARLIGAEATFVSRVELSTGHQPGPAGDLVAEPEEPEGTGVVEGSYGRIRDAVPVGFRTPLQPGSVIVNALRTGRPARISGDELANGPYGELTSKLGLRAAMATPIVVDARYWGVAVAATARPDFPPGTESRLADFTALAATSVANAQNRAALEASSRELAQLAQEQIALRRVATLVARAAPPEQVFDAVTGEVGQLLQVDYTVLSRYEADGLVTFVSGWTKTDLGRPLPIGLRLKAEGRNIHTLVFETGQPGRIDDYGDASGAFADVARDWAYRSSVGTPISVEGRLWGVMIVGSRAEPLPDGTEARLAGFTELVGTALANAEAQAALTASRARIVGAADETRRRIERDLHDGVQQRLISLGLELRLTQSAVPAGLAEIEAKIGQVAGELNGVTMDLREIARGIHPAILSDGGLGPALRTLTRRAAISVNLDVGTIARLPEPIEVAAYYVVSEALTNATRYAQASVVRVAVNQRSDGLHLSIRDDGAGGADPARGSGLTGLRDRAEALGGSLEVSSPPGAGTLIVARLPLRLR
jgi:signal transduction histidine kinase